MYIFNMTALLTKKGKLQFPRVFLESGTHFLSRKIFLTMPCFVLNISKHDKLK